MEDLTPQTIAVLRVLLRKFRFLRELWDAEHKHYGDVNRVETGYASLVKIMLIIDPSANTTLVFSKIRSLIAAFAKEYNDNKRRTRGNCSWYMEELQFLADAKLVCNGDSPAGNLCWLQKPPGMVANFIDDLPTANIRGLEPSESLNPISVSEQQPGLMEHSLRMEVDIKIEEELTPTDPFALDPLADTVPVSSRNESQESFQSAFSVPLHPCQSDPLEDVPIDPLSMNNPKVPVIISRTSPPPLVPRACPALAINLPPLAFFKPAETAKVCPQPPPTKPTVEPTGSAQQTKRSTIFAMHIASKLQGLGLQQRSMVKDIINEVMLEAELGHLKMDHVTDIQEALHEMPEALPLDSKSASRTYKTC